MADSKFKWGPVDLVIGYIVLATFMIIAVVYGYPWSYKEKLFDLFRKK
jgi:hypothetical protein